jgi:hypothetical protein
LCENSWYFCKSLFCVRRIWRCCTLREGLRKNIRVIKKENKTSLIYRKIFTNMRKLSLEWNQTANRCCDILRISVLLPFWTGILPAIRYFYKYAMWSPVGASERVLPMPAVSWSHTCGLRLSLRREPPGGHIRAGCYRYRQSWRGGRKLSWQITCRRRGEWWFAPTGRRDSPATIRVHPRNSRSSKIFINILPTGFQQWESLLFCTF